MCLDLCSCFLFLARNIAPLLSTCNVIGSSLCPISPKSDFNQTSCQLVSDIAMYSASVDNSATDFCFLEFQQTGLQQVEWDTGVVGEGPG